MDVSSSRRVASTKPVDPSGSAVPLGSSFVEVREVLPSIASGLRESVKRERLPIEKDWVAFLSRYEWQWFATFTFRDRIHPEAADKRFRFWVKSLDASNGVERRKPSNSYRRAVWARGLEWQKRGVVHFHSIVGNLPYLLTARAAREQWAQFWLHMGDTGFAQIRNVTEIGGVAGYIAKYTAKSGEVDLSDNLASQSQDLAGAVSAV